MKQQINSIIEKKKKTIEELNQLKNRYLTQIYRGFQHKENIREIHKRLYKETMESTREGVPFSPEVLQVAKKVAKQSFKFKEDGIALFVPLFRFLNSQKVYDTFNKTINTVAREQETSEKRELIETEIEKNREGFTPKSANLVDEKYTEKLEDLPKIFYLISFHQDSAMDHIEEQGKLFIDAKWKNYIHNPVVRGRITSFIAVNKIKTFQWVVGKPTYMITRPNCRHYFKSIAINEAFDFGAERLLEIFNMKQAVGSRKLNQTLAVESRKEYYKKVEVEEVLKKYQQRLAFLYELKKIHNIPEIENNIAKTKFLIGKWKKVLAKAN